MHYSTAIKYLKVSAGYALAAVAVSTVALQSIAVSDTITNTLVIEAEALSIPMGTEKEIETEEVRETLVPAVFVDVEPVVEEIDEPEVEEIAQVVEVVIQDVTSRHVYSDDEIEQLINQGYFTREDYVYMTAVGAECHTSYEGFYAVASCVMNRLKLNNKYHSIKEVVMASGQFEAYHDPYTDTAAYNRRCTQEVKDAAVAVLLGGESNIGDCYYFFCPVKGYDLYADGEISEFHVWAGNVFFTSKDYKADTGVHNKISEQCPNGDILIYDNDTRTWNFASGSSYYKDGGNNE